MMTTTEAAKYLNMSQKTLANWRWKGLGPKFYILNKRSIRYKEKDLVKFLGKKT